MSERAYLLIVSVVFLLIAIVQVLGLIVLPRLGTPAWPSLIAVVVAGFLSYEGFHFAHKAPPKG